MRQVINSSIIFLVLLSACAEQKKLDEMHEATVKMERTTVQMNDNTTKMTERTGSLEQKTAEMKKITDELYDALRQGDALQLRREAYESILRAPTLPKKISEAAKYFMSFEVQLWHELGQDQTLLKRETLAQQAAMEFFLEIEELALRDGSVNATHVGNADDLNSEENRSASFNALAISMHQTNRKQQRILKEVPGAKLISMYSIMEEALLLPKNVAQVEGAAREVLAHEARAIQLLQARYNMFQMIFIDTVSHVGAKSFLGKAKMALLGWTFNVDDLNPTMTDYLAKEVLAHSLSAKSLLIKLGHKPVLDKTVARLMSKMTIKVSGKAGPKNVAQQVNLLNLLQQL